MYFYLCSPSNGWVSLRIFFFFVAIYSSPFGPVSLNYALCQSWVTNYHPPSLITGPSLETMKLTPLPSHMLWLSLQSCRDTPAYILKATVPTKCFIHYQNRHRQICLEVGFIFITQDLRGFCRKQKFTYVVVYLSYRSVSVKMP